MCPPFCNQLMENYTTEQLLGMVSKMMDTNKTLKRWTEK